MHQRLRAFLSGLLIIAVSRPLGAQHALVIDVGLAGAHFPDDNVSAGGPYLRLTGSAMTSQLFGSYDAGAITSIGSASGYGSVRAGIRTGLTPGWNAEVATELSAVAGSNHNGAAGTALLGGRATWTSLGWGGWLHADTHSSGRTNATLLGSGADAGLWASWSQLQISATVLHEATRAELFAGRFRTGFLGTVPVNYSEGSIAVHVEGDRTSFDGSASLRRDPDATKLWETSSLASLAVWAGDQFAFVFTAARQLPDWVRGADAAESFSVGMRFRQPTPERARALRVMPYVLLTDDADPRAFRVRAAGARTLEVMGDFTDWEARPLVRAGSVFDLGAKLTSGVHRLLVRVDGGAWRAAVNTPVVDDEFGGKVGLLVVP